MAGGNLPDIDLAWTLTSFTGNRLGYLLEHRGYTHTLLGCLALSALLYLVSWLWLRRGTRPPGTRDLRLLAMMALLSVSLHLGMDALNSYGVHPFWPWSNHWSYGDAIFIIEPLYWLALAPLLPVFTTTAARVLMAVMLLAGGALTVFVHQVSVASGVLPALALLLIFVGSRVSARTAAVTSAALMVTITAIFALCGRLAAQRVDAIAEREFPDFQTLDAVLSPVPTQPLCWDLLLVQRAQDRYVVRRGQVSLSTAREARACPQLTGGKGTAPLQTVAAPASREIYWSGEFAMSAVQLVAVATSDCTARELMQFVRVPFASRRGQHWILGDLRFDREENVGMAEVELQPDQTACRYHAPWLPPRADLLTSP